MTAARVTPSRELKRQRRRHGHSCWDHLIVAPLWRPACVHWTGSDPVAWLALQKQQDGTRIVSVELADEAIRLADLPAARCRTIVVLGHEREGIPPEAMELADTAVEIPMIGSGASLNVAVAGSLVLYRLAGFL